MKRRKFYSPEFKLKAVVEILKGEKTAAQLAGELEVHPRVLSEWKKHFMNVGPEIFRKQKDPLAKKVAKEKAELFEEIGELKMQIKWLKKKLWPCGSR